MPSGTGATEGPAVGWAARAGAALELDVGALAGELLPVALIG